MDTNNINDVVEATKVAQNFEPETVNCPGYCLFDPTQNKYLTYTVTHPWSPISNDKKHYNLGFVDVESVTAIRLFVTVQEARATKKAILENLTGGELRAAVARTVLRRV